LLAGETKSLYLVDTGFTRLCMSDIEIGQLSDISSTCDSAGEADFTRAECLAGTNKSGVLCTLVDGAFRLDGLNNSGMQGLGPPFLEDVVLNSTSGLNITTDNLTVTFNGSDPDNDTFKNITNWFVNGSSWTVLNMPFEGGSTNGSETVNGTTKDYSPFEVSHAKVKYCQIPGEISALPNCSVVPSSE